MSQHLVIFAHAGAPIAGSPRSITAGGRSPDVMRDLDLIGETARRYRERFAARILTQQGTGAYRFCNVIRDIRTHPRANGLGEAETIRGGARLPRERCP